MSHPQHGKVKPPTPPYGPPPGHGKPSAPPGGAHPPSSALSPEISPMDNILPYLYLGNLTAATQPPLLLTHKITHIISLLSPSETLPMSLLTEYKAHGITHQTIEIADSSHEDILKYLGKVCEVIEESIKRERAVLIHCQAGFSRSCAFVLGFLMKNQHLSAKEAFRFVATRRKDVMPNTGFRTQLEIWERCGYEVWEVVGGVRREKGEYVCWKDDVRNGRVGGVSYAG